MSHVLLAGSLAAAFAAGMVAFFAPCCAGVMMPAYLAAIGGGHRFRVARLTAVYVAGVSVVVLPITLGAAALASYVSEWHPQMFTLGGLMMIGVAIALWRGTMLPVNVPQPKLTGSTLSVFGLGVFSGGATACCAPVLAGAIALSATSGTIAGGLLLGIAYVAGMMAPLIPLALIYGRAKKKVRDPKITLRVGAHSKRIGIAKLAGVVIFAGFGVLFVALALAGKSDTAPGFQRAMGSWMRIASSYVDGIPNLVSLPILLALVGGFLFAVIRKGSEPDERQEGQGGPTASTRIRAADQS
ncbi:MAG TPA: cytochrome c biogenesis protein CcdA [Sphingomicrobium sp.]